MVVDEALWRQLRPPRLLLLAQQAVLNLVQPALLVHNLLLLPVRLGPTDHGARVDKRLEPRGALRLGRRQKHVQAGQVLGQHAERVAGGTYTTSSRSGTAVASP